jgi:5'-methylthioadenosine phosphorylase
MSDVIEIGIIGGSGLYQMPELTDAQEFPIRTPFGSTSDSIIKGKIAGIPVAFIPRHGRGHRLTPTEVPYAANIYALKSLGVKYIIAVSACGSLREDYAPGHICIPDQLVDFTKGNRRHTFFGDGLVAHVGVADPFSPEVSEILAASASTVGGTVHQGGTFVTIEGPRFSTRAESETFRKLGYSIIGMTSSPEAYLALEAEIAYGVFAHITDYDVWHSEEADVSVTSVLETFHKNVRLAQQALIEAVQRISKISQPLPAHSALAHAFISDTKVIPQPTLDKLRLLVGKYIKR